MVQGNSREELNLLISLAAEIPSSLTTIYRLSMYDLFELSRKIARNKVPILSGLLDKLPQKHYHRDGDPVVVLSNGVLTGASSWNELGKVLHNYGIENHQRDFSCALSPLADRLISEVENNSRLEGKTCYFVGHSKGGLVGLLASVRKPELFEKVVTLAPPYWGSEMANTEVLGLQPFKYLKTLWGLRPDSEELDELNRAELPENVEYLNLYSPHDTVIKPYQNAMLPLQDNVINIGLEGVKHNQFLYHYPSHKIIRSFLDGDLELDY